MLRLEMEPVAPGIDWLRNVLVLTQNRRPALTLVDAGLFFKPDLSGFTLSPPKKSLGLEVDAGLSGLLSSHLAPAPVESSSTNEQESPFVAGHQ
jgi:hypothetical protein